MFLLKLACAKQRGQLAEKFQFSIAHIYREVVMKRIAFALVAVAAVAGVVAHIGPAYGQANGEAAPIFVNKIPLGYRDWRLISLAHEAGSLNSLGAVLGNDVAIKAYRARGSFHSPTAQSLLLCTTVTFHRTKTTRSLADPNLSFPASPRIFSLWSKTRKSTPRRAAGGSLTSKTANLGTRRL